MRIMALIKRICLEMLRDKRTLALLFLAPLLILSLMYLLFNGETKQPSLGVVNVDKTTAAFLEKADIDLKYYKEATQKTVVDNDLDGLLQVKDGKMVLTLQNNDPSTAKALQIKINQLLLTHSAVPKSPTNINLDTKYVYGNSKTVFFDVLSPILVGFFVFFFVFLISGIGLLKERTSGTLERIMATPIRRGEIVTAYLIGYGIFAVIQTVIVVIYSITVLDIVLEGSLWNVIFINLLLALVALSLGILLSTFAASEFQMVQFIPIAVIPQIFFAGIIPLDGMADWLQSLGKIMPVYYAADALKGIMYKGLSLSEISGDIIALILFAAIFIVLNLFALKKYRH